MFECYKCGSKSIKRKYIYGGTTGVTIPVHPAAPKKMVLWCQSCHYEGSVQEWAAHKLVTMITLQEKIHGTQDLEIIAPPPNANTVNFPQTPVKPDYMKHMEAVMRQAAEEEFKK